MAVKLFDGLKRALAHLPPNHPLVVEDDATQTQFVLVNVSTASAWLGKT